MEAHRGKHAGLFMGHAWPDPLDRSGFQISRAESGRVKRYSKSQGSGRAESRGLQLSRVGRVRVWESYRTSSSLAYGYEGVTELPEIPGIVARAYRTHRGSGRVRKVVYPYPGYCGTGCTELTEVPGTGVNVLQN